MGPTHGQVPLREGRYGALLSDAMFDIKYLPVRSSTTGLLIESDLVVYTLVTQITIPVDTPVLIMYFRLYPLSTVHVILTKAVSLVFSKVL